MKSTTTTYDDADYRDNNNDELAIDNFECKYNSGHGCDCKDYHDYGNDCDDE